jgi:CBS domain-containing protein
MAFKKTARDIMTAIVITAKEDMLVIDLMKLLLRWHISGVPVVDNDGMLLGIVTEHDVMNFAISGDAASTRASEVMTKQVETYDPDTLVVEIINHFAAHRIRRVPVVEDGKVVGIISRRDIVRYMDQMYSRLVAEEDTEIDL